MPSATGQLKLTVPSGETRYGVAISCPFTLGLGLGAVQLARIYQLSIAETTKISVMCGSLNGNLSRVEGTVNTGLGAGSAYRVSAFISEGTDIANGGSYSINIPSSSGQDLLVLGFNSSSTLQRARIVHNLNASSNLTGQNFTLTASDAVTSQTVNAFTPPAGFTGSYSVRFRSKNNAYARVGSGTSAGGSYAALPGAGAEDLYFALGWASSLGREVAHIRSFSTPAALSFSLPAEWPGGYSVNPAALPTFNNLTHLASDPQFRAYQMLIAWSPVGFLAATVSKGWLGSSTSYSFPDLTALGGFSAKPFSGESVEWLVRAVTSNKTLSELLSTAPALLSEEAIFGLGFAAVGGLEYKTASTSGDFVVP
ncbi:MAG: hypothetical protein RMK51_04560 [Meiothermus sp.]|nr:hypothetical protein [Meiothermus sp.]